MGSKRRQSVRLVVISTYSMTKVDIKEQKNLIRKDFKAKRREMSYFEVRNQSKQICQNFINKLLPELLRNNQDPIFSIYLSANNEVDTSVIIDHFIKNNINFSYPKIAENKIDLEYILHDNKLDFKQNKDFKSLSEPSSGRETQPNILIIPLVVFDRNKNRIGMAKGFFDRSISSLKARNSKIVTIGLGYSLQQYMTTIPAEEHDQSLDFIVSSHFIIS